MNIISGSILLVTFWISTLMAQPVYLSNFQYLSHSQVSGGGPFSGSVQTLNGEDLFEGPFHTNDHLILSSQDCPQFSGFVSVVNGIDMGNCPESVFASGFAAAADSFHFPDAVAIQNLKDIANYHVIADSMIDRMTWADTLIMSEILFYPGGFHLRAWTYQIPHNMDDTSAFNTFANYHNHATWESCDIDGFHHFDFEPTDGGHRLLRDEYIFADSGVIYIQGGQLRVSGIIQGQYTLITDHRTEYMRPDTSHLHDYCYNNIWLTDDLLYADADPVTGAVPPGGTNKLGLVSGANIIVANTLANGGMNSSIGSGILVNGALVTLQGSFLAHYWQNTTDEYFPPNEYVPGLSKGDGRGPTRMNPENPNSSTTGSSDLRGTVVVWGSLIQYKPGLLRRRSMGPYNVWPGIGYDKAYHYDLNLLDSPPPGFQLLTNPLNLTSTVERPILPSAMTLEQNFPNPFNGSTSIRYNLGIDTQVSLVIYDLQGRRVQTLISERQQMGRYAVAWNGAGWAGKSLGTGIYFARLSAADHSQVIKMLYLE